ncbi:MAG: NUDIX domain-containing protein [Anaerolineae bacterium]|jgi:8-oxo-dGTP diphosphatase|nr:MAG: NUDIX domain-containing protein [Anaerolineae bacterium]MCL4879808.1 NUDIX domain-containing protein [Anaerolineae bacterium]
MKIITSEKIDGTPIEISSEVVRWRPTAHAVLLNEQRHILVLDNLWTGKLDLPGGGIEIWETIPEALVREVWEETGLNIKIGELLDIEDRFFSSPHGNHYHSLKIFFRAKIVGGILRPTILEDEPSVNPHWVDPRQLSETDFQVGWQAIQKAYG